MSDYSQLLDFILMILVVLLYCHSAFFCPFLFSFTLIGHGPFWNQLVFKTQLPVFEYTFVFFLSFYIMIEAIHQIFLNQTCLLICYSDWSWTFWNQRVRTRTWRRFSCCWGLFRFCVDSCTALATSSRGFWSGFTNSVWSKVLVGTLVVSTCTCI